MSEISAALRVSTLLRLGLRNVLRVAVYRLLLKLGVYRRLLPIEASPAEPYFSWPDEGSLPRRPAHCQSWDRDAERVLAGELPVFSREWVHCGFPPDWQRSVTSGRSMTGEMCHWTLIPDFDLPGGDVKGFWEPARFDGLRILCLAWIGGREKRIAKSIEQWLGSWSERNPANAGVQWKCGQESGLRLLQLLLCAHLLRTWGDVQPRSALLELISQHCARIDPTMLYAIGQDNNHGTSEAAALFVAGSYLANFGDDAQRRAGDGWRRQGRRWLENRIARLVMPDGSFSQHSTNYHRLLLDTCSFAETWRRAYREQPFSRLFHDRCAVAARWLADFTDPATGDAPNIGANDGARMFVLCQLPYRDYRASVQWASVLFCGCRAYGPGSYDDQLLWLGLESPELPLGPGVSHARCWPDGGYVRLYGDGAALTLRLPTYRFRPSHSDALHLDISVGGHNVVPDAGTFSYNADSRWLDYFGGVTAHNTVQFDSRDQMPRLSRFLFAAWLKCDDFQFDAAGQMASAGYRDYWGASHVRKVEMVGARSCRVVDSVSGFGQSAVLRWRLTSDQQSWIEKGGMWTNGRLGLRIESSVQASREELVDGWEARYYGCKNELKVLEFEVQSAASITTEIFW